MTIEWLLKRGERGIILGQTGSGKTRGAIHHLVSTDLDPVIIFDTKIEPAFDGIARHDESMEYIDSMEDFETQWKGRKQPNYLLVRPTALEVTEPLQLDESLEMLYAKGRSCYIYIDEAYQWHDNGRAGAGLVGILTRGRSKGMTTLLSSQRPSWVSRFCFTEVQKYFVYLLSDRRDLKTVGNYIPGFDNAQRLPKYHSYFYQTGVTENPLVCSPVPVLTTSENESMQRITKSGLKWV